MTLETRWFVSMIRRWRKAIGWHIHVVRRWVLVLGREGSTNPHTSTAARRLSPFVILVLLRGLFQCCSFGGRDTRRSCHCDRFSGFFVYGTFKGHGSRDGLSHQCNVHLAIFRRSIYHLRERSGWLVLNVLVLWLATDHGFATVWRTRCR